MKVVPFSLDELDLDVWEVPLPLARRAEPPTFPITSLPDWIRRFVVAEAEATQTPPDMAAMFVLAALATAAGGRVQVEPVPGWIEGVNLFVAVAMEPGSRKSAVHRDVIAPLVAYERLLVDQAQPDIAEKATIRRIAEATLARVEKAAAGATDRLERLALEEEARIAAGALDRLEVPASPRLFTADVTPEKLASMLHENGGRMAVLSAEGGVFDLMAGRYSAGIPNLDVYLAGHAGDVIRVDRRGRPPEFVDRPALTIGLAVQPFVLAKAARIGDFAGRGLLDRFLYAIPKGTVGYRRTGAPPVPEAIRQAYDSSLRAVAASFDRRLEPLVLSLTPDASAAFTAWMSEIEPRRRPDADLGHIQGWASKLDGAVARIAGLLHVAESVSRGFEAQIDELTITASIEIGGYLIDHALAAFDLMGGDPALDGARTLVRWIRKDRKAEFTKRECHIAHRARFPRASDLDPVLDLLLDHGYIRPLARDADGHDRRSVRFEVNPATWTQPAQPAQPTDVA